MVETKSRVMKILFYINGLSSGGKERRLVELMKGLKTFPEIEFELVTMSRNIDFKEVYDMNIKIHYLIRRSKKDLSVFKKFYRLCKEIRPDIIHCWDSMTAVYAVFVCKMLHIKLVNGMVVNTPVKQNIFDKHWLRARLSFPFSDIIVGNSKAGLKAYKAPQNKSLCIYNGFNFKRLTGTKSSLFKEGMNFKPGFVVTMVGNFSERKDYNTYISASKLLCDKRKDIIFFAIGDGENFMNISNNIERKYQERIKLMGKREDVESIIKMSDICVLVTNTKIHGEGISNSILEYMAFGKPVIATEGGGTSELVVDGVTGFLIKYAGIQELTDKINVLVDDRSLRLQMGEAGRERINNYFSIERMVNKYVSVYHRLYDNRDILK
jgi:glycosyltransferase involved in cell wall biosynthesis